MNENMEIERLDDPSYFIHDNGSIEKKEQETNTLPIDHHKNTRWTTTYTFCEDDHVNTDLSNHAFLYIHFIGNCHLL